MLILAGDICGTSTRLAYFDATDGELTTLARERFRSRDAGSLSEISAYAVFTIVASSTVAFPLIAYLVMGSRADSMLRPFKDYLIRNNRMILAALLLILGGLLSPGG